MFFVLFFGVCTKLKFVSQGIYRIAHAQTFHNLSRKYFPDIWWQFFLNCKNQSLRFYATRVSVFRVSDRFSETCLDSFSMARRASSSLSSLFAAAWNGCRNVAMSNATLWSDWGDRTRKMSGLCRLSNFPFFSISWETENGFRMFAGIGWPSLGLLTLLLAVLYKLSGNVENLSDVLKRKRKRNYYDLRNYW